MRKITLILFLVIFSCSKDKDVEEEVVINYSLSITSAEGGTVNDSAGSKLSSSHEVNFRDFSLSNLTNLGLKLKKFTNLRFTLN